MKELLTNFSFINIPFTKKTDYYWKKLPQNSSTVIFLIWCLKEFNFIPNFSINISFFSGGHNYIIYYNIAIFLLQVEVLMRCKLIEISQYNVHFIQLFSVKHPETYILGIKELVGIPQELFPIYIPF